MTLPNTAGPEVTGGAPVTAPAYVLPRVNLMPPEIAEAARFRRFQLAMGGAVVAAVAIVGALYVNAHSSVGKAQGELDAATAQHTALQHQLTGLQSVSAVYADVAAKQAMLQRAMGSEIRWSYYLNDLALRVPDNVWLTSIQATSGPASTTPTTTAAPTTTTPSLGTVNFAGTAFQHDDVATWLDAIAREKGFTNAYFSNSTKDKIGDKPIVTFKSSVDLTADALSGRYTKPAGN